MVKYYSFVVFISVLLPKFLLELMHKCTIHTTVNTAPEHGCRLDPGRVYVTSVYTNREHGSFSLPCCLSCYIQVSFQKNSEYNVTANKKQIVVYDWICNNIVKEKMEKVTVVGYHICGPVCYSWNKTYKDDDLLVGHAAGLCVAMSAVSEVHVYLLTNLSLMSIPTSFYLAPSLLYGIYYHYSGLGC